MNNDMLFVFGFALLIWLMFVVSCNSILWGILAGGVVASIIITCGYLLFKEPKEKD